eukprot:Hpha_TRINITY_DN15990_c0_g3::TRINITY_DN15990_c0_g3_i3::g.74376::m.74376
MRVPLLLLLLRGVSAEHLRGAEAVLPEPLAVPTTGPTSCDESCMLMKFAANISPTPDGWGGDSLCTAWKGVTCDNTGRVQKIDLHSNQLSGAPDLTKLPSGLTTLALLTNQFSGTPDLTNLPSGLTTLVLSNNHFSGTPDL